MIGLFFVVLILILFAVNSVIFVTLYWQHRRLSRQIHDYFADLLRIIPGTTKLRHEDNVRDQIRNFLRDMQFLLRDQSQTEHRKQFAERMRTKSEEPSIRNIRSIQGKYSLFRTSIEIYPLLGILGTIVPMALAVAGSSELLSTFGIEQSNDFSGGEATLDQIIQSFGGAIASTGFGLAAAIIQLIANAVLEPRMEQLAEDKEELDEILQLSLRELGVTVHVSGSPAQANGSLEGNSKQVSEATS